MDGMIQEYLLTHIRKATDEVPESHSATSALFEHCSIDSWTIGDINANLGTVEHQWSCFIVGLMLKMRKSMSVIDLESRRSSNWATFHTIPSFCLYDFQKMKEDFSVLSAQVPSLSSFDSRHYEMSIVNHMVTEVGREQFERWVNDFLMDSTDVKFSALRAQGVLFSGSGIRLPIKRQNWTHLVSSFAVDVIKNRIGDRAQKHRSRDKTTNKRRQWSSVNKNVSVAQVLHDVVVPFEVSSALTGTYDTSILTETLRQFNMQDRTIHFEPKLLAKVSNPIQNYPSPSRLCALVALLHYFMDGITPYNQWLCDTTLSLPPPAVQHNIKDHFQIRLTPAKRSMSESNDSYRETKRPKVSVVNRNKTST